ncbi:MAG: phage terminase large subunit family protein [bacterium]|nr:phage terminase large subunit family protein [bacterium]
MRRRNMPPAPRHPAACDTTVIDDCRRGRQEFSLSRSLGSGNTNRTKDCRVHPRHHGSQHGGRPAVDGYEIDVDGEGDPVERAYQRSDQRRYHVPCPICGVMAPILWQNFEWPDGQPEQAALRCESCQALLPNITRPPCWNTAGGWPRPKAMGSQRGITCRRCIRRWDDMRGARWRGTS